MEITEYIAWQVFETDEKLADLKTTSVNGITTNSGALTRVYLGNQVRRRSGDTIIQQSWEILAKRLQHFNSELEQKTFWTVRTSTESSLSEPLGSIAAEQYDGIKPNFLGKSFL